MAAEVSKVEIERFLSDAKTNSQSSPSMLALLFAIVALGAQQSIWNNNGVCYVTKKEAEAQRGNVYSMSTKVYTYRANTLCSCCSNASSTIGFIPTQAIAYGHPNPHSDRKTSDGQWEILGCIRLVRHYHQTGSYYRSPLPSQPSHNTSSKSNGDHNATKDLVAYVTD